MVDLSVIIPTSNESDNLKLLLPELIKVIQKLHCEYEIIVADTGFDCQVVDVVKEFGAKVFVQERKGYGAALKEAFLKCKGHFVITMDADLSHNPYVVKQLYKERNSADIVIASRYIRGGFIKTSAIRKCLSALLNRVFTIILDLPLKDISSGYRLYKRDILRDLDTESDSYEILEEIIVKAYMAGYLITEIPFHYFPRQFGKSHIKPMQCAYGFLKTLYKCWKCRNSIASADYDERAFYSRVPLQRYWQRKRHNIITEFSERCENILDIGCGSSKILESIPQAIGMDLSLKKMRYRKRLINPLVCADAFSVPFKDGFFDEVICSEVIEHVPMDMHLFEEFNRILKSGGILILGTPDYSKQLWVILETLYKWIVPNGYAHEHISHYTLKSLRGILKQYGFEMLSYKYVFNCELIIKAKKIKEAKVSVS